MKAVVCRRYGSPDVMRLEEVAKPEPGNGEVLVKVIASSVNAADWHLLEADPFIVRLTSGFLRPKHPILGADVAGIVEEVGRDVKEFKAGHEVFGDLATSGWGGFAEYVCAREDALVHKPAALSFEKAAAVPLAAVTALQGLRDKGGVQPGQKVLIHGASGGVGTFAVQLAKWFGAEVTGVASTGNVDMVRSLGANRVIDYTREDFAEDGQRYDLILAVSGDRSVFEYKAALSPGGTLVGIGGSTAQIFQNMLLGPFVTMGQRKKIVTFTANPNRKDLALIRELLEAGEVVPVIDRRYTLSEVPDAIRYLEKGHARGKVIITV